MNVISYAMKIVHVLIPVLDQLSYICEWMKIWEFF